MTKATELYTVPPGDFLIDVGLDKRGCVDITVQDSRDCYCNILAKAREIKIEELEGLR